MDNGGVLERELLYRADTVSSVIIGADQAGFNVTSEAIQPEALEK